MRNFVFKRLLPALVSALVLPVPPVHAQDAGTTTCWCSARQAYEACVWSCEAAAAGARSRKESQAKIPDDLQTLVPAFLKARARLHETAPDDPNFKQIFEDYRRARVRRDNALAEQYVAAASRGLFAFLTGGVEFKKLDAMYEMREPAQSAYHEYMMKALSSLLDAGPAILGQKQRVSVMESSYGRGSAHWYAKVADEAELMVWSNAHNGPVPKIRMLGDVEFMQRGSPKLFGDMTAEEQEKLSACLKDAKAVYPGNWAKFKDVAVRQEAEAYLKECKARSCTTCVY